MIRDMLFSAGFRARETYLKSYNNMVRDEVAHTLRGPLFLSKAKSVCHSRSSRRFLFQFRRYLFCVVEAIIFTDQNRKAKNILGTLVLIFPILTKENTQETKS